MCAGARIWCELTSPSKRKGSAFELEVARYLAAHGFPAAERAYGAGRPDDRGDIAGVPGVAIECKAVRAMDLAGWLTEAKREAENAGGKLAVVVAKRRMASVSRAYVVMELEQWCELAKGSE